MRSPLTNSSRKNGPAVNDPGPNSPGPGSRAAVLLTAAAVTALVVSLVFIPEVAYQGALKGLRLWWEVVLPALLPFFVGGQMLMGLGVVHALGVMLEPMMRPVFNLPGVGGFVTAMGLASGYPIGAVLTARLRREGEITVAEGERLMSFANTADPLFMGGAVALAMFGHGNVAGALMGAHYAGALVTGFLLRFYKPGAPITPPSPASRTPILPRMGRALLAARRKDGRPFGQVLGDSVRDSMQTLLLIGGFIMIFAVIIDLLVAAGVVAAVARLLVPLLHLVGVDGSLAGSLVAGTFEITLGSQLSAEALAPLQDRLMAASAIIAWAGLSVHAQVAALTQGTGMSIKPYLAARFVHALAAGALLPLFLRSAPLGLAWWAAIPTTADAYATSGRWVPWAAVFTRSTGLLVGTMVVLAVMASLIGSLAFLARLRLVVVTRHRP